ncbi:MAG: peptide deformylase [Parcubacteria group bacterium]|jgi:peptide deformylase
MDNNETLNIIKYPDGFLRNKTHAVKDFSDPKLELLIKGMVKAMEVNKGIGLAAPQVGSSLKIFICRVDNELYALINPEIKSFSKKKEFYEEGCLSFPGKYFQIERPIKVKVKAYDLKGKKIRIKADGLLARVIQHEIDHLDGVLIIDRVKSDKKDK